ncbi:hypothetical protein FRC03_010890 [Tulasnella sp. 419]|nr:hypothetical protein FRC03_010890 [Tulasnella sp. 419]
MSTNFIGLSLLFDHPYITRSNECISRVELALVIQGNTAAFSRNSDMARGLGIAGIGWGLNAQDERKNTVIPYLGADSLKLDSTPLSGDEALCFDCRYSLLTEKSFFPCACHPTVPMREKRLAS